MFNSINYLPWIIAGLCLLVLIVVILLITLRKKYTFDCIPNMDGKVIVITGSTSGIGYETALELAKRDAHIILASRNPKKGEDTITNIKSEYPNAKVEFIKLDTSSLESVRNFKDEFEKTGLKIDALVLNAGICKVPTRELSVDGYERQFATNYLGHFALTSYLMPYINDNGKIVSLSSLSHSWSKIRFNDINFNKKYKGIKAYAQSKLAMLMFSYELSRRLANSPRNIKSIAVHPGISKTAIVRFGDRSGGFAQKFYSFGFSIVGQSQKKGALPSIYAICEDNALSGAYYGPDMLFGSRGYPKKARSNRYSKNEDVAKKLWELSLDLAKVEFDI